MHPRMLAPSLLASSHAHLARGAQMALEAGCKWLHVDIMDGHFVPNLTFGPQVLQDVHAELPGLFYDVHLMLDEPHRYAQAFIDAGAGNISIHVEPQYPLKETIELIKKQGVSFGIALNPATPAEAVEPYLNQVDIVLMMTVQPGFGGQAFHADMLDKLAKLQRWRAARGYTYRLEVDGGIDHATWKVCAQAGADTFVVGSAFYRDPGNQQALRALIEESPL